MAGRDIFARFVDETGGRQQAADLISVSYSLVCHILNGERGISKDVAEAVEEKTGGRFSKTALLWGEPVDSRNNKQKKTA